jgi:hypothetical protein
VLLGALQQYNTTVVIAADDAIEAVGAPQMLSCKWANGLPSIVTGPLSLQRFAPATQADTAGMETERGRACLAVKEDRGRGAMRGAFEEAIEIPAYTKPSAPTLERRAKPMDDGKKKGRRSAHGGKGRGRTFASGSQKFSRHGEEAELPKSKSWQDWIG